MFLGVILASIISGNTVVLTAGTDLACATKESTQMIVDSWRSGGPDAANEVYMKLDDCQAFPAAMSVDIVEKYTDEMLDGYLVVDGKNDKYLFKVVSFKATPTGHPEASPLYFIVGIKTGIKVESRYEKS